MADESGLTVRERLTLKRARKSGVVEAVTAKVSYYEPEAEATNICPTCGVSGDDPCVTPSGKVKDTPHAKRGS